MQFFGLKRFHLRFQSLRFHKMSLVVQYIDGNAPIYWRKSHKDHPIKSIKFLETYPLFFEVFFLYVTRWTFNFSFYYHTIHILDEIQLKSSQSKQLRLVHLIW